MLKTESLLLVVILETIVKQLDEAVLVHASVDFKPFQIADVSLFVFSKSDGSDESRFLQFQSYELR